MHISQKKKLIKRFGVDLKRFCREAWGGGLHSIQSKLASCSKTISFQPQVSFDCFFCFLSTEWLMVLFLYNPLGVTNSIGSNSHMESVESDGKEREIKEIKNIIKTKFSIYSSADSDLFFQRQQRWMRGCEREPVKRSLQFWF